VLKRQRFFGTPGATFISSMLAEHYTDAELRVTGTHRAHELMGYQAEADPDRGSLSIGDYPPNPQG
jgi:hypothetical protein